MNRDVSPLPGYAEPYGLLLAILQDGTREWREEVWDDVPANVMVWRAVAGGPSMGSLILHNIAVELLWFERYVLGRPVPDEDLALLKDEATDVDAGVWPEAYAEPLSWYFELQDRYRAKTLEMVREFPAPHELIFRRDERGRSAAWVFGHVIQHESYHGGQVVMLYEMWKRRQE